jgi:hypothetical protein
MLNRLMAALALSSLALAQKAQPFDPHDLSGFWDITKTGLPAGALNETSNNRPQMTPWGLAKFQKTKTGYDAKSLSNGVFNEKDWNDPLLVCDPTGFPRIMWSPTPPGMRFAQTSEEVIQFFEDGRTWRDIWTDGRKLPGDEADSRWFGYTVGHWDGDTFVVSSNNFDDHTWLDQYGSPHSDEMTVEERYRRVDRDHLELVLNITDPKTYVGTWKGDKKIFQLVEKPARSQYNDLNEGLCVWSETKNAKAAQQTHR